MRYVRRMLACAALAAASPGCGKEGGGEKPAAKSEPAAPASKAQAQAAGKAEIDPALLAAFPPLPDVMAPDPAALTEDKIALGRMLFYDTRFSMSGDISCNTCHDLERFGVDNTPTSTGHQRQRGARNSPSVYNAAGHVAQFWDGRAPTVEEQAKGPVTNPVEMAMPGPELVLERIRAVPAYVQAFGKAFPGEAEAVSFDNFGRAIGAFERKLVTPSRWDAFLKGDANALTEEEKRGFNTFVSAGCATCHAGAYVGGSMFQKVGVVKPWPNLTDEGRFKQTGNEVDRYVFKVPSLRNVEKTQPYFHDGSVTDLSQAVKMMAEHQLGRTLSDEDTRSIVTWLKTLTGEPPRQYIQKPALPPGPPISAPQ